MSSIIAPGSRSPAAPPDRWIRAEIKCEIDDVLAARPGDDAVLRLVAERALGVKVAWPFTSTVPASIDPEAQRQHDDIAQRVDFVLRQARDAEQLAPDTDLNWARHVFSALIETTVRQMAPHDDPQRLASRLVDTYLHGLATRREPPPGSPATSA
jgi:hypothetical protein